MERLPDQHGRLFQAPERWEELLWRHHCHRGSLNFPSHVATHVNWSSGPAHQGPQDDSVRLLPLLQKLAGTKSCQASYHYFEGNQSLECPLDWFTKTFFWNFQNIRADLCYILIYKQMLEKVFCSNIAPSLSSGNHLFYKAEYMGPAPGTCHIT